MIMGSDGGIRLMKKQKELFERGEITGDEFFKRCDDIYMVYRDHNIYDYLSDKIYGMGYHKFNFFRLIFMAFMLFCGFSITVVVLWAINDKEVPSSIYGFVLLHMIIAIAGVVWGIIAFKGLKNRKKKSRIILWSYETYQVAAFATCILFGFVISISNHFIPYINISSETMDKTLVGLVSVAMTMDMCVLAFVIVFLIIDFRYYRKRKVLFLFLK